jgi:hypothetical protein
VALIYYWGKKWKLEKVQGWQEKVTAGGGVLG